MEERLKEINIIDDQLECELRELDIEMELQSGIRDHYLIKKQEQEMGQKLLNDSNINNEEKIIRENKNNQRLNFEEFSIEEKINKVSHIISKENSSSYIYKTLHYFKIMKGKFIKQNLETNIKSSSFVDVIQVKFDPLEVNDYTPINIRIINDFYCILDLLEEVCKYHNLDFKYFDLLDEKGTKIPLTMTVKNYFLYKPDDIINRFVFLKKDNQRSEIHINIIDKNSNLSNQTIKEKNNIEILNDYIIEEGDNLINRYLGIVGYLFFVALVFMQSLSRFGIKQSYFIDNAIKTQIFEKTFFLDNINELRNSFKNLMNSEEIYDWLEKVNYIHYFRFQHSQK